MTNLIRHSYPTNTAGMLIVKGHSFRTHELVWDGNKPNISCIPDGIYPYRRDKSINKDRLVIELLNVPDRSEIQIHADGNLAGCVGLLADGRREDPKEVESLVFSLMGECGFINIQSI